MRDASAQAAPTADPLPAVEFSVVDVSFDAVADPQLREYLQTLPTTFALSEEAVDRLRARPRRCCAIRRPSGASSQSLSAATLSCEDYVRSATRTP